MQSRNQKFKWSKSNGTPGLKAKPTAHSMCVQESSLHIYRIENGYKITNVTIYSIYYTNKVLQKTKLNTLGDIAAERLHNSTSNQPGVIARLELHIEKHQIFFSL
jgi:hypothetical protein